MSATNHTANYNLPQFVGSDKPAWLGDVNPAMNAIDTAMHANAVKAQQGVDDAQTAQATAETAEQHAQDAITDAGTAQTTANQAIANIGTANAKIDALATKMQLTEFDTSEYQLNGTTSKFRLTLAQSEDGSVFKIYGVFLIRNTSGGTINPFSGHLNSSNRIKTGLYLKSAPSESFSITPIGLCFQQNANGLVDSIFEINGFVETDGEITLSFWSQTSQLNNNSKYVELPPCLYFNTNFGDTPTGE